MRTLIVAIAACVCLFEAVDAQVQPNRQRRQLQQQIIQRLMQNSRDQAGMTDEQYERFRQLAQQHITRGNELRARERELWRALEGQMRPGIAADTDSVETLIQALAVLPIARAEMKQQEQREFAEFLSPVQRAQLLIVWRRFEMQVQRILQNRAGPNSGQAIRN